MAQRSARPDVSELYLRVLSASVLLPISVAVVWIGGWYFVALVAVVTAIMCLEWLRVCGHNSQITLAVAASLGAATAVLAMLEQYIAALALLALGAVVAAGASRSSGKSTQILAALGVPYVGLMAIAAVWLRDEPSMGHATVLWLMFVVFATDSAGFTVGRLVGGPRLIPKISPSKTWSGLAGGILAAAAIGLITAQLTGQNSLLQLAGLSACLALVAQFGDFIESSLKRYFYVKDAGGLIPGHGGFLDRMDGFLVVTPAVAFLTWIFGGSPLTWR